MSITCDHAPVSADLEDDDAAICPNCGDEVDVRDLQCSTCGEPLDDPTRGICGFCGVATDERCAGCSALVCWECSEGRRTGTDEDGIEPGTPWCPDCRPAATG